MTGITGSAVVSRRGFLLGGVSAAGLIGGAVMLAGVSFGDTPEPANLEAVPAPWLKVTVPEGCGVIEHDDAVMQWAMLRGRADATGGWSLWVGVSAEWVNWSAVEVRQSYVAAAAAQGIGLGQVSHRDVQLPGAVRAYKTVLTRGRDEVQEHVAFLTVQRGNGVAVIGAGCTVPEEMTDFWAVLSSVEVAS